MYRSIIIDDESKLREVLRIKLEKFCPNIEVVGYGENILEARELISTYSPDIVFLDIEMPGGSGFDLLDGIGSFDFQVIFVTGYNDYAIDALKLCAVDYLLKPLKTAELITAVAKAEERLENTAIIENYEVLKHNLNHVGDQSLKVCIPNNEAYEFVQIKNIIRCEGWNKYTKVHLMNNKQIISSYNIGVFKDMLESHGFYSCHKSHLINKDHIKRYLKEGIIVMEDDGEVPLARRRKDTFTNEVLGNYIIR